jgi:TonB family protein
MSYRPALLIALAVLLLAQAFVPATAAAQSSLAQARDLYLAADYEAALAALGNLRPSGSEATEAGTYKVLCLLALGRTPEATREIEAIVATDPFYQPPDTMASPRVRDVFRQARLKVLPGVAQREYAAAKAAFDRRDPAAATMFERVLALLDEPGLLYSPTAADLRLLAAGFRDLSREFSASKRPDTAAPTSTAQAPVEPAATPPSAAAPATSVQPAAPSPASVLPASAPTAAAPPADAAASTATPAAPAVSGASRADTPAEAASKPAAPESTASPTPTAPAPRRSASTAAVEAPAHEGDPGVTPPVAIEQPMPRWIPPAGSTARRQQFEGVLELLIDARGAVANATLRTGVHPEFDQELLTVARTWKFKPAMRGGVPTPYVKYLQVRLSPPR